MNDDFVHDTDVFHMYPERITTDFSHKYQTSPFVGVVLLPPASLLDSTEIELVELAKKVSATFDNSNANATTQLNKGHLYSPLLPNIIKHITRDISDNAGKVWKTEPAEPPYKGVFPSFFCHIKKLAKRCGYGGGERADEACKNVGHRDHGHAFKYLRTARKDDNAPNAAPERTRTENI